MPNWLYSHWRDLVSIHSLASASVWKPGIYSTSPSGHVTLTRHPGPVSIGRGSNGITSRALAMFGQYALVASSVNGPPQLNYFADPSQPEVMTLQAARRAGGDFAWHMASACCSAVFLSAATAQPTPGVPASGSSAPATH